MRPITPYGCAKAFATQMVRIYRDHHGLFACNAISYNHESPRRGENFVTRKICRAAAEIKLGKWKLSKPRKSRSAPRLERCARRGAGYMMILDHSSPDDFACAAALRYSVRDVAETAFASLGLDWKQYVRSEERLFRLADPVHLCGDATKARTTLSAGSPLSPLRELIAEMTQAEIAQLYILIVRSVMHRPEASSRLL